jgi:PIN domain nuclease of toxin-antitoxin system
MNDDARLSDLHRTTIAANEGSGIGVSVISCWEVSLLVQRGRLAVSISALEWVEAALTHPAVSALNLTPKIAVASTELPEPLHRDPADRILIATAMDHGCPILTMDREILAYPHVQSV